MVRKTRTIAAGEFKAKCLALLDEVGELDEEVIVTKRGKPVARLVPLPKRKKAPESDSWPFPDLSHLFEYIGDVITPIDVEWEAMK
ncbi:MAG: type II toxin-antitoxin system Phd/YefM family antitoxin [Dehalococcoidia bacterium]